MTSGRGKNSKTSSLSIVEENSKWEQIVFKEFQTRDWHSLMFGGIKHKEFLIQKLKRNLTLIQAICSDQSESNIFLSAKSKCIIANGYYRNCKNYCTFCREGFFSGY